MTIIYLKLILPRIERLRENQLKGQNDDYIIKLYTCFHAEIPISLLGTFDRHTQMYISLDFYFLFCCFHLHNHLDDCNI